MWFSLWTSTLVSIVSSKEKRQAVSTETMLNTFNTVQNDRDDWRRRAESAERQLAEAVSALQSIAASDADEEMDRLHREGTSWERIYENRANDALEKIGGQR